MGRSSRRSSGKPATLERIETAAAANLRGNEQMREAVLAQAFRG